MNTIDVKNIDSVLVNIKKQGGTIISEKSAIPGIGWFAQFKDPEGNVLGVMQDDSTAK